VKTVLVILVLTTALLPARADTLTLTTGEILTGDIVAETATDYSLRTANANYSIVSTRLVAKTDVRAVQRDTPEQKARRASYENLCRYNLNPNQEYTAAYYNQVIALMEKFLATWPDDAIRAKLAEWNAELAQVSKGRVKYNNYWMSPAEKNTAVALAAQQTRLAAARKTLETQTRRLADLQTKQENLTRDIAATTTKLETAEAALANLRDFSEPMYEYRPVGGSPYAYSTRYGPVVWSSPFWERVFVGERITRHPMRASYEQQVVAEHTRLDRLQADLEQTTRDITAARADLEKAKAKATK
jgi:hypothetical protein